MAIRSTLALALIVATAARVPAQAIGPLPERAVRRTIPMTNAIRRAFAAGTRDSTGRPGRNYTQLRTDYTINARDLDPNNPLLRLYLGPQSVYTQFVIDGHRALGPRLRVGGSLWLRSLLHSVADQGPFDTSFEDYRVDAQVNPLREVQVFLGYHERDSDRLSPFPSTDFFDVSKTGSTKIQDFTAEIGHSFGENGRLSLRAGGFYRRMNFQDQFYIEQHLHDRGVLFEASVKIDSRTRAFFNYDLDSDFFLFAPNVKDAQSLRVGLAWKY